MTIGTIRDLDAEKKTVLLRLDLNSPIDPATRLILDDKRFREHIPTIRELAGSRVVIVTHQSRPGKKDFTPLDAHAEKLEQLLGKPVTYVDSIFNRHAQEAVRSMKIGDVVMLENVRFNAEENLTLKPEEAKKTHLVKKLSAMADVFVNDAFGTAHRSQPTVVGLPLAMRSAGGLLMEKEVFTLSKVFSGAPKPVCMVLGGTKVDDSMDVAKNVLDRNIADSVIVIGVVGNVFLIAAGYDIGKPSTQLIAQLKYQPEIEKAKEILKKYKDRVILPQTVAVREKDQRREYPVAEIP
ncbi:MAG: phosphoglycerate kinase, partial [Methanomicrobiales archaeon]|nr:phosphoglycerate kinase [Methanomicrobiales archaeon]